MATIFNTYTNYVNGTGEADLICSYVNAYIHGNNGNDSLANMAQTAALNGDNDNDTVVNFASNSITYLDGGSGNDCVANQGVGGIATIYGGYDIYNFTNDNDILIGNPYAVDVFVVGECGGTDVIYGYDSNDMILCATTGQSPPVSWVNGNDVLIAGYGMTVVVSGAAQQQLNMGYTLGYQRLAFDTAADVADDNLCGASNVFYGTADADNIFIGKGDGNDLVFGTDASDTIHLCDVTLDDIVGTAVNDTSIAIAFNTGETAVIASEGSVSSTFKLASGESYVYNREAASWQKT